MSIGLYGNRQVINDVSLKYLLSSTITLYNISSIMIITSSHSMPNKLAQHLQSPLHPPTQNNLVVQQLEKLALAPHQVVHPGLPSLHNYPVLLGLMVQLDPHQIHHLLVQDATRDRVVWLDVIAGSLDQPLSLAEARHEWI